jgi:thiol-disulfide isomerase/thioredoxin
MRKLKFILLSIFLTAQCHAGNTTVIQEFKINTLEKIVASHKGHAFVLVLWSLDCEYCQASLNTLSEINKSHKISVVTIATDSILDRKSAGLIRQRLKALGFTNQAWAFGEDSAERLRYAIDKKWHGEMPRSYWFDSKGQSISQSGVILSSQVDSFFK